MGKKTDSNKATREFKLDGNLTIYEAVTLRERFSDLLNAADILEVDFSGVGECDTSGLQILCSAKKTADRKNKRIFISMMSGPVRDVMIRTGITREMIAHDGGTECQR